MARGRVNVGGKKPVGTAIASDVLLGKTFSSDAGIGLAGSIPLKSSETFTPGTTSQTIAAGQYLSGLQTILGDPDLIASNIRSGVNIFGVIGNVVPIGTAKQYAQGIALSSSSTSRISITGLSFTPRFIIIHRNGFADVYGMALLNTVVSAGTSLLVNTAGGASRASVQTITGGVAINVPQANINYDWWAFE